MPKKESLTHVLIDFTLPPPIYGYEFTTIADRAERTIKLVKSLERIEGGILITALEGQSYEVPIYKVKFLRTE